MQKLCFVWVLYCVAYQNWAYGDEKLKCAQMRMDIDAVENLIEARTIKISEIPAWYFGIPGLIRYSETLQPLAEESDRVLGEDFRLGLQASIPQLIYYGVNALAYPLVMSSHLPGDMAKIPYFALTKAFMKKRLAKMQSSYELECKEAEVEK